MNFHYVSLSAMQPADDNDFVPDLHSVQGLHVRKKHFDQRIWRPRGLAETRPRDVLSQSG